MYEKSGLPSLLATFILMFATAGYTQTEAILHSFSGGSDGGVPVGGVILDSSGNVYGTTQGGGAGSMGCRGCGVAFELTPGSNGAWTEKVLYNFGSVIGDALAPQGVLAADSKGNLYGISSGGGSQYQGAVFELSPGAGGSWTESVLYSFPGTGNVYFLQGGVVLDAAGNLYGVADGGTYGFGAVYELVAGSNGTWTEKVLYSFTGGNDGAHVYGTLLIDGAGNLYGVTASGGSHDYGTVFELIPGTNGNWSEKVLYSLPGGSGGSYPAGSLVMDAAGNLYGEADYIVYELSPNSNGTWTKKSLHSFGGGNDGAVANGGLVMDKNGILYGTTDLGGNHRGTVFMLTPSTTGKWTEKVLHRFSSTGGDGINPAYGTLAIDAAGHIYGVTSWGGTSNQGVVYEVTP